MGPFGTIASIIRDKNSSLIFNLADFKRLIYNYLDQINIKSNNLSSFTDVILKKLLDDNKINIITIIDAIQKKLILVNNLNKKFKGKKKNIRLSNDFSNISDENIIIVVRKGFSDSFVIKQYLKKIDLLSLEVNGWILIED